MKKAVFLSLILVTVLMAACTPQQEPKDVPKPPTAPKQQEPESAKQVIENYGERMVTSVDKAKGVQASVDIREVQRAIQDYALSHDGAYPPSLDDVKDNLNGSVDLSQFNYNPSNGAVSIKGR